MAKYSEYKDSGQQWLGMVPSHWKVDSMKHCFNVISIKGRPDLPQLCSTQKYGVIPQSLYENRVVSALKGLDTLKVVSVGDFVISLRSFQGGIEYAYYNGIISPAYTILRPRESDNSGYYKYLLKSQMFVTLLQSMVTGIREGQNIDYDKLKYEFIPIPPRDEQEAIVAYLDKVTADIDKAIAAKERIISTLEERRKIIITHAVTRGINPDAPMKDSGIDWLGEIPAHWEIIKLGALGSTINGVSNDSSYFGSGFPFVSYSDVYKNYSLPASVSGLANSTPQEQKIYSVQSGDVFFTRTSETAEEIGFSSVCIDTIPNAVFAGFLIRFRPQRNVLLPQYSKYYFRASVHRSYFVKEMNLVIRASLNQKLLRGLPVLLPPKEEQIIIAEHLDIEVGNINRLIKITERQIELLRERKNIIINETVTGKVKVI